MTNLRGFTSDEECDEILLKVPNKMKSGFIREAVKSYAKGEGKKWLT